MSFITTRFPEILLSDFRGIALTRKNRTDGLTDDQKNFWIKNIPSELVMWDFMKPNSR